MIKRKRSGMAKHATGEPSNSSSRLGADTNASNVTDDACDSVSGSYYLHSLQTKLV